MNESYLTTLSVFARAFQFPIEILKRITKIVLLFGN
jgi:hypothetical protein